MSKMTLVTADVKNKINWIVKELYPQLNDPFKNWDTVQSQTVVLIPSIGTVGIEVTGQNQSDGELLIIFWKKRGSEWRKVWKFTVPAEADRLKDEIAENIYLYDIQIQKDLKNQKKRKYEKGEVIKSLDIWLDQEFVFFNDKVTHRGWFLSWQLKFALDMLCAGRIYYAVLKEN